MRHHLGFGVACAYRVVQLITFFRLHYLTRAEGGKEAGTPQPEFQPQRLQVYLRPQGADPQTQLFPDLLVLLQYCLVPDKKVIRM